MEYEVCKLTQLRVYDVRTFEQSEQVRERKEKEE